MSKGGAGEVMSLGIYGWFFEQFIGKQGLDYANNGNGREKAATAVDFGQNGCSQEYPDRMAETQQRRLCSNRRKKAVMQDLQISQPESPQSHLVLQLH